jgi:hypothetical protein
VVRAACSRLLGSSESIDGSQPRLIGHGGGGQFREYTFGATSVRGRSDGSRARGDFADQRFLVRAGALPD